MADKQASDPSLESGTATPLDHSAALTLNEGIDALTDLLGDDPDTDLITGSRPPKEKASTSPKKAAEEDGDDADDPLNFWDDASDAEDGEEAEGEEEEAEGEEDEDEEEDEDGALKLSDDLEITLDDGTKATLAALKADYGQVRKREADMQRHFTQSMQKVSEEKAIVSTQAERVIQHAQEVRRQRELIEAHAKRYMPAPPQRPQQSVQDDPVGWMEYRQAKEDYEEYLGSLEAVRQADAEQRQREAAQQAAEMPKILNRQRELLLQRYPRLRDPELASKTMQDMVGTFTSIYGFPPEEVMQVKDARLIAAMLDATAFHRLKAKKPAARKAIENKPKLITSGKRMDHSDQKKWGDKAKLKRLAQSGSLEAGADALMDLI